MKTVKRRFSDTLEVKQSKFIAHLVPYAEFEELLAVLRAEHPKARHFVTAFRMLNEYDQVVEGSSDDGEPRGTSGKPTLAVMQGQELIDAAVITVRYFGGTKLGTGGLVRAYGDAANLVIAGAETEPYRKESTCWIAMRYGDAGRVEYAAGQAGLAIVEKRFEADEVFFALRGVGEDMEVFFGMIERCVRRA